MFEAISIGILGAIIAGAVGLLLAPWIDYFCYKPPTVPLPTKVRARVG